MAVSFIIWVLIALVVAWFMSLIWSNPQGCIWDGGISIVAALTGVIVFGAITGPEQLLEINIFSLLAGIITALIALAVVRGVGRSEEPARTDETTHPGEPMGVEKEAEEPLAEEPLSERPPEELGEVGAPPDEESTMEEDPEER